MNEEINSDLSGIKKIKSRSFFRVGSLIVQGSYSAALGFVAFLILTIKSGVYLLGIYNTVLAMMSFFNYFTNLGLAAAIVQKKEIEEIDLNTAFFIQLILSVGAVVVGFFLTSNLFRLYKDLPYEAVYLYWAVLFSFFLLSLKTIPSVLLEKKIKIYKVVLIQAIENTVFYLCVIVFSLLGWEIYSLVMAVLLRSLVGLIGIYLLNPWFPKPMFSFKSAKSLLSYGIPFQGNSFLAMIKDDLLIIYLGGAIGLKNLGYVTFGKKYGEFSIRLIMDSINRVAFPLFSRFQKEKELLKKSLERVLFYESFLIFPMVIGALFIFDSLLKIIPGYYAKWNSALFSFYFFSLSAFFISLSTPFINLFNAVGRIKLSLCFMILWTVLIWLLVPLFIKLFGYNGISVAFFIMSLTFIFVFLTAKKIVNFSINNVLKTNLFSTLAMGFYLIFIRILFLNYFNNIYLHLFFSIIGAVLIYFFVTLKTRGKVVYLELIELFKTRNE